jgi:site-specific DNA recombinase
VQAPIDKLEEKKRKYLGLYEMDEIDRDLFTGRLNDLNMELDFELARRSRLELELRDDQAEPVSHELVRSLMGKFDALLRRSPFPQRKTLLHLIVKRITQNDRKRVGSVELAFKEETEKRFLSAAPSADNMAEGAAPIEKTSEGVVHRRFTIVI